MVHYDSQKVIDLTKNTMYHARTKHIDMRYHWIGRLLMKNNCSK